MKKLINKTTLIIPILALAVLCASACSADIPLLPESAKPQEAVSNLTRQDQENYPLEELSGLVKGNTAFALDLYQQLAPADSNLFFSPYSISSALAMTYAGAAGETAKEMAQVFHFPQDENYLHSGFNALGQYLEGLSDLEIPKDQGDPFQLNIANAIWGQKDFHFEQGFLDTLAVNYGAGLRLLDYIQDPEKSRQTINDWVSDQTQAKIQDLIPQGAIDSDTRLVLSNAIYFKATWLEPFQESRTEDGPFYGLDGEVSQVSLMSTGSDSSYLYYDGDGFQAIALPYVGGEVSMLVLLPDEGNFADFRSSLVPGTLETILGQMSYQPIQLRFPKFEFESEFSLADTLAAMGMPSAFSGTADFSRMTGAKDLFISNVFHKAYVGVDEEGTEAAAATAVVMTLTAAPLDPLQLTVDRPFLFLIRDHQTDTILFLGQVTQP